MEAFLVASRLVHFAAAMVLFGASLFRLYAGMSFDFRDPAIGAFDRWLRRLLIIAALLALLSALAWLDALAATMSGEWGEALSAETIRTVLFDTAFGAVWKWRLGIAALLIVVLFIGRWTPSLDLAVFMLSAGLLLSLALVGHAATGEGAAGATHGAIHALHLAATAAWIGGLVPLGYLLGKAFARCDGAETRMALQALPRFSRAGYLAVSLILFSGVWLAWRMTGGFADLFGTLYGRVVLTKVGLFAAMTTAALVNRFYLWPRVAARPTTQSADHSLRLLWRSVAFEQGVALAILIAASVLGTLEP